MQNTVLNNIQKNQSLKDVLENQGIIFDENNYMINIEEIGYGSNSNIYEILGLNKVLKISRSEEEFKANEKLQTLKRRDSNISNYFLIPLIIAPTNQNFYQQINDGDDIDNERYLRYYFILDKLIPLNQFEKDIFNEITFYYTNYNLQHADLYEDEEVLRERLQSRFGEEYKSFFNWLIKANQYLLHYKFVDAHIKNIMKIKDGDWRIIDLQILDLWN